MIEVWPWQVWLVDLGRPVGHEQGGVRPAVVVGSEVLCRFPIGVTLVAPMTTRDRGLDHHVRVASPESGLREPSWVRPEDMRSVSVDRFRSRAPLGTLSRDEAAEVSRWVARMVASHPAR